MAGKPFVLLGINSDQDVESLKQAKQEEKLEWRNWWDGGIEGPIHKQWQVTLRPMVYLLDAQGVIRFKNILGEDIDRAVDTLLADLASAPSR